MPADGQKGSLGRSTAETGSGAGSKSPPVVAPVLISNATLSASQPSADEPQGGSRRPSLRQRRRRPPDGPANVYGALDLGTNNCRLLLARPSRRGFKVVDAFSRIIRLGEGLSQTGLLTDDAMVRTINALKVCAAKLQRHDVRRTVANQQIPCRAPAPQLPLVPQPDRVGTVHSDQIRRTKDAQ